MIGSPVPPHTALTAVGDPGGVVALSAAGAPGPVAPTAAARSALRPLPLPAVALTGAGMLAAWQRRSALATLPHCVDQLEASGALRNLRRRPGDETPHEGMWFSDSDVYKTLEALAWQAGTGDPAPRPDFATLCAEVAAAQDADGYLNSYYQHDRAGQRFSELHHSHELYCAGHLIQAAVAANRAGLGDGLLRVARRFADLIVDTFGADGGNDGVCGHPEIETALVELYRETGHRPYLELAKAFVDRRGYGRLATGAFGAGYFQDHAPVREAAEFTGHAVRQVYLLAGVVDVAVETGDAQLLAAAERLWESAFGAKTYITGAHGSRHRDEAVGDDYELPPDRAYAETCAAIGSFQWNWRLLLATGAHRYADELERVLYNAIAVATAVDGTHFFYSNPLHLRTGHDGSSEDAPSQRLSWYSCACCPPNLARLVASLHSYLATTDESGIQVHLYADARIADGERRIVLATRYPWEETVTATVSGGDEPWTLALRVPGWCEQVSVSVDGVPEAVAVADGYVRLTRQWTGQRVELRLGMPPRLVTAHPRVDAVRGCVALTRGPLVFCLEQADLPAGTVLEDVTVRVSEPVRVVEHDPAGTVPVTLVARGRATPPGTGPLYRPLAGEPDAGTPLELTAVPYFLWGNRDPGAMRVWIPAAA
jgi:uncharacterized protein